MGRARADHAALADHAAAALAAGRYEEARTLLQGARASVPEARLVAARLSLLTGDYQEARVLAQGLTGHRRLAVQAQTLLGEAAWALGDWQAAGQALSLAAKHERAHRARIILARLRLAQGDRARAAPHLAALIADYNNDLIGPNDAPGLSYVAMAARELHSYHDANDAFALSARANPARSETQLEWASLFLEKGDLQQARESIDVALKYNPNHPWARTLNARLVLEHGADFAAAKGELERALAVNPNFVPAHVLLAGLALHDMDTGAAARHVERALAINPRDLEALSTRVAIRFLADDQQGQARAEQAVLELNPHYSRMYAIVARYAEWEHRYEELVRMARKALLLDPEDPAAHATLALNLLRVGREQEGLAALREAWERDHFNVRVYNVLNLFEQVIQHQYVRFEAPPFRIRVHRDERKVLEPYLVPMLRRAYADMVKRYGFEPDGPIDLELFADEEHFSVRTSGVPNLGVQGVCFGKVITALSPAAGSFNWGQILWHELSHVFHLQLSKNHVPRWFTEGLAEYETVIARPEWRREDDHDVWLARNRGTLPELVRLNSAFTHARSPQALMTAYHTSSLAVTYLVERYGFERITPMLRAWAAGKRTPGVFAEVLGQPISEVAAGFDGFLAERLARYDRDFYVDLKRYRNLLALAAAAVQAPTDANRQASLALGYLAAREPKKAESAARRTLRLHPGHPYAHFALSLVYVSRGQVPRAYRSLRTILERGYDGYDLRLMLAKASQDLGKIDRAVEHTLAASERDPEREEAWQTLVELSEPAERRDLVVRALSALVKIDQHGRIPHMALLVILAQEDAWPKVRELAEQTLYLHPASSQLHRLLGDAYRHTGAPGRALTAYDQALTLGHKHPGRVQLGRARALGDLGRLREQKRALAAALLADPGLSHEAREVERGRRAAPGRKSP